ncbi:hypothetical protein LR48_Vigan07g149000 [Vigna angularis]|uniref:Uncharacterized protein n=1 Tax=Phaseolus angularis TaxID=3914 RepID=A0A0L9UYL0_PHAAN|nr:hypothetical protein LR48_Vigan07g149000 [Vigna angularis]
MPRLSKNRGSIVFFFQMQPVSVRNQHPKIVQFSATRNCSVLSNLNNQKLFQWWKSLFFKQPKNLNPQSKIKTDLTYAKIYKISSLGWPQEQCQNLQNFTDLRLNFCNEQDMKKRQTNKSRWTAMDLERWMDCRSRAAARGGSGAVDEDEDIQGKNGGGGSRATEPAAAEATTTEGSPIWSGLAMAIWTGGSRATEPEYIILI